MEHKLISTYNKKEKKMKKILLLLSLFLMMGCYKDDDLVTVYPVQFHTIKKREAGLLRHQHSRWAMALNR